MDVKKSMNTHLHILEAYTNLYRAWKDEKLERQLENLILIFLDKIINNKTYHFHLFFDDDWTVKSRIDSYGHDIEGSWLLCEAAEILGDERLIERVKETAIKMANVAMLEGLHESGGMYYEKDGQLVNDNFSWWTQAETVIGFYNAWQLTNERKYYEASAAAWEFIKKYIIDKKNGGWHSSVSVNMELIPASKASAWKAPYHSGRMCMEMMRRLDKTSNKP
jgi:mannobiose 2-epimerase